MNVLTLAKNCLNSQDIVDILKFFSSENARKMDILKTHGPFRMYKTVALNLTSCRNSHKVNSFLCQCFTMDQWRYKMAAFQTLTSFPENFIFTVFVKAHQRLNELGK